MAVSIFTYNISRPWPFKWFTPVVLLGTVILMVLFSLLNLVSNGYVLAVQYTDNPNATTTSQVWFNKWPSFLTSKVRPTCQASGIAIGTKILTNNTALTYTLDSVSQITKDNPGQFAPTLIYQNNLLSNCAITSATISYGFMDRTATQIAMSRWGVEGKAFVTCQIGTDEGIATFNLTAIYNYIPSTVSTYAGLYAFTGRNATNSASLYWGESLLSMYWRQASLDLQNAINSPNATNDYAKGTLTFLPNPGKMGDMTSLDYFQLQYRWVSAIDGGIEWGDTNTPGTLSAQQAFPNVWTSADAFIKSLYSTVLVDLGQTASGPNILTNTTLLQHYTANFSRISEGSSNYKLGPALQDYNSLKAQTGPLGISPSVILSSYLCSSPHLKPTGDLIVAVFIADLVLLSAAWSLFKFIMGIVVIRKDPQADYCEGHVKPRPQLANTYTSYDAHPHIMGSADDPIELVSSRQNLIPKGYSRI